MPRTSASDAIEAYALHTGCSRRTAARHSRGNHPDFVEFLTTSYGKPLGATTPGKNLKIAHAPPASGDGPADSPLDITAAPASFMKRPEDRTPAEHVEAQCWETYTRFNACTQAALAENRMLEAVPYGRMRIESLDALHKATRARQNDDIARRNLIPIAEFVAVQAIVAQFAEVIMRIPDHAAEFNPADPQHCRAQLERWLGERLQPARDQVTERIEAIVLSSGRRLLEFKPDAPDETPAAA